MGVLGVIVGIGYWVIMTRLLARPERVVGIPETLFRVTVLLWDSKVPWDRSDGSLVKVMTPALALDLDLEDEPFFLLRPLGCGILVLVRNGF